MSHPPICMGGWCERRDACAHYHQEVKTLPIERLCEPGKTDAWRRVDLVPVPTAVDRPDRRAA